ncbi:MAG: 2-C-methyl-D-erythritol 4-phosphate cytidylyltransferase [Oscillospiraceae bacterium]
MRNVALIFAGGVGSRMGADTPKQFLKWGGKTIVIYTLEVFEQHEGIDEIVIACKEDWMDYLQDLIRQAGLKKVVSIVPGGATALDSQYNGLTEIKRLHPEEKIAVLIHDGVRPLVDAATIQRNIDSVWRYGNAITVTNAIETVIRVDGSAKVQEIMDRDYCRMAKAPQSFLLDDILQAHEDSLKAGSHTYIDSASLMSAYGHELHTVEGKPENIKITTPSDYYMFMGILAGQQET